MFRSFKVVFSFAAIFVVATQYAHSGAIYSYQGPFFTEFPFGMTNFTTSDRITGTMEITNPPLSGRCTGLGSGPGQCNITSLDMTASGVVPVNHNLSTISTASSNSQFWTFDFDASGNITRWAILMRTADTIPPIITTNSEVILTSSGTFADLGVVPLQKAGTLLPNAGQWTLVELPGESPDNPVLPGGIIGPGKYVFTSQSGTGMWFDPPFVDKYFYQTDGNSNFTSVGLPPLTTVPDGDGLYEVVSALGTVTVSAGGTHNFSSPVGEFTVRGINPLVDGGDPLAFPTFLTFDQQTVSFTMTAIPEPTAFVLALVTSLVIAAARLRGTRLLVAGQFNSRMLASFNFTQRALAGGDEL